MALAATRWMSFSSSTSSTSGRATSAGAGFGGSSPAFWCSPSFRSQRLRGAPRQNACLYCGFALQKQVRQVGQTSVRSVTRQEHQGVSSASNVA